MGVPSLPCRLFSSLYPLSQPFLVWKMKNGSVEGNDSKVGHWSQRGYAVPKRHFVILLGSEHQAGHCPGSGDHGREQPMVEAERRDLHVLQSQSENTGLPVNS